ncbi:MAG: diguanylate cyclase [Spirochaetota bacterium]
MASDHLQQKIDTLNKSAWEVMLNDPLAGLSLSQQSLSLSKDIVYKRGVADSCLNMGWCYIYMAKYQTALDELQKALTEYVSIGEKVGEMKTYNAIGVVFQNLCRYEDALKHYNKSLMLAEETGNRERRLAALNNIGELYWEIENHQEALNFFKLALAISEETGDKELEGNVLVNIGIACQNMGEYTQAQSYLERALKNCEETNDKMNGAKCLTSIGLIYQETGDYVRAEEYHKRSLEYSLATENRHSQLEVIFNMGLLYRAQKKWELAIDSFLKAVNVSEEINAQSYTFKSYRQIAASYEDAGDYKKAVEYYRTYHEKEKAFTIEETNRKLKNLRSQYESEKSRSEAEIYTLRNVELKKKSEELEKAYERITILSQAGQKITASLDIEKIMYTVYDCVKSLMEADAFGIALYDSEKQEIDYRIVMEKSKRLPRRTTVIHSRGTFAAWCIVNKKPLLLNDIGKDYKRYLRKKPTPVFGESMAALIYLPLAIEERIIGVLTVQSLKKQAYTPLHVDILTTLGAYIAIAIENSIIHEKVNLLNRQILEEKKELEEANKRIVHLANHDNLTGLHNRRLLSELMQQAMPQVLRVGKKLGILYIDLDDFKPVNDNFGHEVGDAVLKVIAERLKNSLRLSDTIARIGGDEFIAVISNVDNMAALQKVVEKIIKRIKPKISVCGVVCELGASIGICIYPDDDQTFDGLLKKADIAMYMAKQKGKNSYKFYGAQ